MLVALDGIQVHCSDLCSTRRVVADGHSRVLPLMPACAQPRQDPAAGQPELSEKRRKQDCELNAAQRRLAAHAASLRSYRPVFLGDDL